MKMKRNQTDTVKMINWYNEVSRNLEKIPDCIAYFDKELIEAKKQCKIYGNLERARSLEKFGSVFINCSM
jgi:hypothetical protein